MHKSRLSGLCIDCETDDLPRAAAFWGAALGRPMPSRPDELTGRYIALAGGPGEPGVVLQRVEHAPRVHLDLETDDVEAEVRRLESLGARVVERKERWTVMEAPSGHRYCVCTAETDLTGPDTRHWS